MKRLVHQDACLNLVSDYLIFVIVCLLLIILFFETV
jgi:hypothetical protein